MTDLTNPISESENSSWANGTEFDEFDYIPVSPWGPVALVLGIASLTGLTNSVFGLCIAFVGVVLGIAALLRIKSNAPAVRGISFAAGGLVLSVLCLGLGSVKLVHAYENECPEGFLRVNFPKEISKHEFVYHEGKRRLSPAVAPLIGQRVFLKGFMWETQRATGLTEFVFLKDNGECCFGGEPKPFDMMVVSMTDDKTTNAYGGMIAVSGILHANVNAKEGEPVYTVDATIVEEAQTSF